MTESKNEKKLYKKVLNVALLVSLLCTVLVPLTGLYVHKLASVLFLLLSVVHLTIYRKKMGTKRVLLFVLIVVSFVSGVFGMIFDEYPLILQIHKAISIAITAFLAIHIFVYHKRLR